MSNTPVAPPAHLEATVREASLRLVHQQLPLALIGSMAAAFLVYIALDNDLNLRPPLTLWLLTLGISHGIALLSLGPIGRLRSPQWRRRAYLLIYATGGLIWGLLGLVMLSVGLSITQLLLVILALVATTGGVMISGLGLVTAYPAFLVPAMLPLVSIALALGGNFNILLTALLGVFSASTLLATLGLHRALQQLLHDRVGTSQRLEALLVSNRRLQREADDYRRLRKLLNEQETHHQTILETMDCGVYLLEGHRFIYANPAWERLCGYPLETLQTLSLGQLIHPDDRDQILLPTGNRLGGSPETDFLSCRLLRQDGTIQRIYLGARTLVFESRLVGLGTALSFDEPASSTRRRKPDSDLDAMAVLQALNLGIITTDTHGWVTFANPAAEKLHGWRQHTVQGRASGEVLKLLSPVDRQPLEDPVSRCLAADEEIILPGQCLLQPDDQDNETRVVVTASPLRDRYWRLVGSVVSLHGPLVNRTSIQLLTQQARLDPPTGLLNRSAFLERLGKALESAREGPIQHALCQLTLALPSENPQPPGEDAWDERLKHFSETLLEQPLAGETLARLDVDSIGLLIEDCPLDEARARAEALCQDARTLVWQGQEQALNLSAGLTPITEHSQLDSLLPAAELACQIARHQSPGGVHIHHPDDTLPDGDHGQTQWLPRLRAALADNQLRLHCQAVIPLAGNSRPLHGELRLGLADETEQLTAPTALLSAAERYRLMPRLDRWVVEQTLVLLRDNHPPLDRIQILAIPLSGQSLGDREFHGFLLQCLDRARVDHRRLCFELTETAMIGNLERAERLIHALRERGCSVALSDFGSGLSSFSYLKQLPVNYLKIDGGFFRNIRHDPQDRAIVDALNRLAHALGLETVAEFAADQETLALLKELGLDYARDSVIAEPIPHTPGTRE